MSVASAESRTLSLMLSPGAELLRDAWDCSLDCSQDPWQLAVEICALLASGLTRNDLRWLISRGLAEHRKEITRDSDRTRRFSRINSLALPAASCLVFTPAGRERVTCVRPLKPGESLPTPHQSNGGSGSDSPKTPHAAGAAAHESPLAAYPPAPIWSARLRELRLGGAIVKRFRCPAAAQELILNAFQEESWPLAIDDPLPAQYDQDPKRRLHYTVRNLNRGQSPLRIRFFINGNGETIRWEIVTGRRDMRASSARAARRRQ